MASFVALARRLRTHPSISNAASYVGNSLKVHLLSRCFGQSRGYKSIKQRVGRVLLLSGSGSLFVWDQKRIYDWEIDECLAQHDSRSSTPKPPSHHFPGSSGQPPASPKAHLCPADHASTSAVHTKLTLPEKMLSVHKNLKMFWTTLAKRILHSGCDGSSHMPPRVVSMLLAYVLPSSSLYSSTGHQPSSRCPHSSRRPTEEMSHVLTTISQKCQEIKRSVILHLEEDSDLASPGQHQGESDSPAVVEGKSNSQRSKTSSLDSEPSCRTQRGHFNSLDLQFSDDSVSPSQPALRRPGSAGVSKTISRIEALHKLMRYCSTSVDESAMVDDFHETDEFAADFSSLGALEFQREGDLPSGSRWDPFLDAPVMKSQENLENEYQASLLHLRLHLRPPQVHSDSFIVVVGGSLFSDSFCLFESESSESQVGSLSEVGHTGLEPLQTFSSGGEEREQDMSDEALLWVGGMGVSLPQESAALEERDGWVLQLERMGTKVYFRPVEGSSVYEYRVIGSFEDISGANFAKVQTDPELRKQWDNFVLDMEIIDRDPLSGSEVLHWTAKLPFPLKNRDYVFVRRTQFKKDNSTIVMISRTAEHPNRPATSKCVRVTEFVSTMIIQARTDVHENGFQYELTYIDNPKCTIPSALSSWATSSGIPDYMHRIHNSALDLKKTHPKTSSLTM